MDTISTPVDAALVRPLFLVDLDDTLFQTERKIRAPLERHVMAAEATNGRHSWFTHHQSHLLSWMFASADVIPVTARSRESFGRCRIPAQSGAILCNGGLILSPDGSVDETWARRVREGAEREADTMAAFLAAGFGTGLDVRGWVVEEEGVPLYACFKSNTDDEECLDRIVEIGRGGPFEGRFSVTRNGNNVAAVPLHLSKRVAVEYLMERIDAAGRRVPVFGMGDSLSDLPFMDLCHFKVVPTGSQIDRRIMA